MFDAIELSAVRTNPRGRKVADPLIERYRAPEMANGIGARDAAKCGDLSGSGSNPHEVVQFRRCDAPVEETELARVCHLVCGVEESRHCSAIK